MEYLTLTKCGTLNNSNMLWMEQEGGYVWR
jgi:hypothetical protein